MSKTTIKRKLQKKELENRGEQETLSYESTVVEQWKTCVEAANGITEKRNNANSIFITLNTALFAVISFSLEYRSMLLAAVGIVICVLWLRLIDDYKKLNSVKYAIINEMEEMLPLSPFKEEWRRLNEDKGYCGLTKTEKLFLLCLSYCIA